MSPKTIASISSREFAVLRHGLRYVRAAVDAGRLDLTDSDLTPDDLTVLDYKLGNMLGHARRSTSGGNER